jgi:hypothetical protein
LAKRNAKSNPPSTARKSAGSSKPRRTWAVVACLALATAASAVAYQIVSGDQPPAAAAPPAAPAPEPESLDDLLTMSPEQLANVDIAEMNLLCAVGLPGAEELDRATIDAYKTRLDQWAQRVKFETARHMYRLTDPRFKDHAEYYKHSEARFRAAWLVGTLMQDIGVHYHPGFVPQDQAVPPFKTSKETFLHGLLDHPNAKKAFGGNCVSMPTIYAAVGRRLGYPIKLVSSQGHIFCRWEGLKHPNPAWRDRFNFDGSGNGFSIDPDEFYMTWPTKSTPRQAKLCDWLKTLTPKQELATFLLSRAGVLTHVNKDYAGAQIACARAAALWPTNRIPLMLLYEMVLESDKLLLAAHNEPARPTRRAKPRKGAGASLFSDSWPSQSKQKPKRSDPQAENKRIQEINRRNAELIQHPANAAPTPKPLTPPRVPARRPIPTPPPGHNPAHNPYPHMHRK